MENPIPNSPEPRLHGAAIVGLWALASATGAALSSLSLTLVRSLAASDDRATLFFHVPAIAAGAAVTAAIQTSLMQRVLRRSEGWFAACFAGAVLAAGVQFVCLSAANDEFFRRWSLDETLLLPPMLLSLIAPGYIQFQVLRKWVERAEIWVVMAGLFSVAALIPVNVLELGPVGGATSGGLIYGAVMGLTLIHVSKHPRADVPREESPATFPAGPRS